MLRFLLALAVALIVTSPAIAGMKAIYSNPINSSLFIEIADNGDLRMGDPGSQDYFLLIGDAFYIVGPEADGWRVMRATDMATAIDTLAKRASPPQAYPMFKLTIERHGQTQVNGRAGMAYGVKGMEGDPQREIGYVISDDPTLTPIGRGLAHLMEFYAMTKAPVGEARTNLIAEYQRIAALGTPIGGDLFKLESVKTITVDPRRLALPAKPMTVEEIIIDLNVPRSDTGDSH